MLDPIRALFLLVPIMACDGDKGLGLGEGEGEGEGEGGGGGGGGEGEGEDRCEVFSGGTEATPWSLPGFGEPRSSYQDSWEQWFMASYDHYTDGLNWSLQDMTGDGRPDLLVTWRDSNVRDGDEHDGLGQSAWLVYENEGDGFSGDATVWSLPDFGEPRSSYQDSWEQWFMASYDHYTDGLNWSLQDMTGDGRPDLLVTWRDSNVRDGDEHDGLGQSAWLVYENEGDGFSGDATVWSLPDFGEPRSSYQDSWEQWFMASYDHYTDGLNWSLQDMTGDDRPDLLVTWRDSNVRDGDEHDSLGQDTWLVYENEGDGFSGDATVWSLPDFGEPRSSYTDYWEQWFMASYDHYTDGLNWSLQDMTGDGRPDLLVTWRDSNVRDGDEHDSLGQDTWLVYENEGDGFSSDPTLWSLPGFGEPRSSYQDSWEQWFMASYDHYTDGLNWSLSDMNGDGGPDLLVTWRDSNVRDGDEHDSLGQDTWLVYENEGDGFSDKASWSLPGFGEPRSSYQDSWEQWFMASSDYYTDGLNWSLSDMNGDGGMDILVTWEDNNVREPLEQDGLGSSSWAVFTARCEE